MQVLTILIKVNCSMLNDKIGVDQETLKTPISNLLVAKLKNSHVIFSYFIGITHVEATQNPQ